MTPAMLSARVKGTGRRLGFDLVAVGPAHPPERGPAFEAWLDAGSAGTMAYLERGRAERLDPGRVVPGARSLIACALNYHQGPGPGDRGPAHVARYARGADYHDVMLPRLRAMLVDLQTAAPGTAGRAYVDTGPVLERELAARAGLGWVGKSTMLLNPELGSYFFIGVILTTAELAFDAPLPDRCGSCTRCLDACPTEAFAAPYVLDARRCVSYLTIEHRGPIPRELRPAVGTLAFGCDICQEVCPWNRHAPITREAAFLARDLPDLVALLGMEEDAYARRLRGSPLKRAGRRGLRRNAAVGLGNSDHGGVVTTLMAALDDPEPQVRAHVAWALGRQGGAHAEAALGSARARERNDAVRQEIDLALARRGGPEHGDRPDA